MKHIVREEDILLWLRTADEELQKIAGITERMAIAQCANYDNPRFSDIMKRHEILTCRIEKLLDEQKRLLKSRH